MNLQCSRDWVVRPLCDGSAVAYNPFVGDLHALPEVAARLLEGIPVDGVSFEQLAGFLITAFPDDDPEAVRRESELHVSSLIELGVISRLADQQSTAISG